MIEEDELTIDINQYIQYAEDYEDKNVIYFNVADFINDASFQNAVNVQETAEQVKKGWKESDPIHYNRVVDSEFNKPEESNEDSSQ